MVETLNQSNAITMMSLLWWGALTNQNHAWPVGVYRREFTVGAYHESLLRELTAGVYRRSLPQEFTSGVYRGSLPREFTTGAYHGSLLWEFTVGAYHWLPLATTDLVGDNREFEV